MASSTTVASVPLKVAESRLPDVGRGLARLDPADIHRLSASVGSILQITGKKTTAARVMPAFREARGSQAVQIDGLTRSNAGTVIGEKVTLTVVEAVPAQRIVLVPEGTHVLRQATGEYVGKFLADLPVNTGDRVRVTLFGSRFQEFRVTETVPNGIVLIRPDTSIRIELPGVNASPGRISYEDIGGLGSAIRRVREMIELPLRHPAVFARLGIDPPKGVLLYGPPGCGKTLLARAVASETDATFLSISGPEVITKYYGESEAKLRQLFEQARKEAPAIIFLDEIDSIASKREHATGEVEKRVVAQLLALMDGLEARGQIIVIAATNLPNSLDAALRRPGRFDREIVIGIPDVAGRREVFELHTRGMPLAADVDIPRLAETTHGFTGADVAALCREAAMAALRRVLPKVDLDAAPLPYEQLLDLYVSMSDFYAALKEVEPSALREVMVEVPEIGWDDIGGLSNVKQELREIIEWPSRFPELFQAAQVRPPKGILLQGPPGAGKTLLAKAVARQGGLNFISIKGPGLISKYVGESERGIREIFRKARQAAPCVIFFDEFDALAPRRGGSSDGNASERIVTQILVEMDGIALYRSPDLLAVGRLAGRFDRIVELGLPNHEDRVAILEVHNRTRPLASDVQLEQIARQTEGFSGAELEQLSREAAMTALRESVAQEENQIVPGFQITRRHFQQVCDAMTKKHG